MHLHTCQVLHFFSSKDYIFHNLRLLTAFILSGWHLHHRLHIPTNVPQNSIATYTDSSIFELCEFNCVNHWFDSAREFKVLTFRNGSLHPTDLATSSGIYGEHWVCVPPLTLYIPAVFLCVSCCCFMAQQQQFSYILVVIWCMRRGRESLRLYFYRLKGSLTSHTI